MKPLAAFAADGRVLLSMLRGQSRRGSHAERLQAFYAPQADRYDAFRAGLLHGREELIARLELEPGMRLVELGCGTGQSLDIIGSAADGLAHYDMVDLCPALLAHARRRAQGHAAVAVHEADVTNWMPDRPADRVLISYALTMIPEWSLAIDAVSQMLAPGGRIGVVDFHLPGDGRLNGFWRRWFAHDGVHVSADHLPQLRKRYPHHWCSEREGRLPYVPLLTAPYYLFIGHREMDVRISVGGCR